MAADFTREQVAAIAALAHLDLDPSELDLFAKQLSEILAYAEEVQGVDTTGVPPTASVAESAAASAVTRPTTRRAADRDDAVRPSLDRAAALGTAPDAAVDAGFYRVPRVIG